MLTAAGSNSVSHLYSSEKGRGTGNLLFHFEERLLNTQSKLNILNYITGNHGSSAFELGSAVSGQTVFIDS